MTNQKKKKKKMKHRWILGTSFFFFCIWLVLFCTITVPEIKKYRKTVCRVVDIFFNESITYPCDCSKKCFDAECGLKDSCSEKMRLPRRWDQTRGDCCDGYYCAMKDPNGDSNQCYRPIFNQLCEIKCPKTCYDYNVTWVFDGHETVNPEQMFSSQPQKYIENQKYEINKTKTCYFQKNDPEKMMLKLHNQWKWAVPFTFFVFFFIIFLFWIGINFY
jgi:hypothetical protein